jgi:hypothetical protein
VDLGLPIHEENLAGRRTFFVDDINPRINYLAYWIEVASK